MEFFDNFESNLELILKNEKKMAIFSNFIKGLPEAIKKDLEILAGTSDEVIFAVYYQNLSKQQKRLVNAMLKVLSVTDNEDVFVSQMSIAYPHLN